MEWGRRLAVASEAAASGIAASKHRRQLLACLRLIHVHGAPGFLRAFLRSNVHS